MNHDYFPENEYESPDPIKTTLGKITISSNYQTINVDNHTPFSYQAENVPTFKLDENYLRNFIENILKEKGLI